MARDDNAGQGDDAGLARWSRLKAASGAPAPAVAPEPVAAEPSPEEVEAIVAALPSLESIAQTRDVAAFLARGVPQALRNAALDRLWRSDPAIWDRIPDAIDYAENYLAPETIAGWGAAPEGAGRELVERLHAAMRPPVEPPANDDAPPPAAAARTPAAPEISPADDPAAPPAVAQPPLAATRRRHGGALPGADGDEISV